jgi:hypothetical protein
LQDKKAKTKIERYQEQKALLKERYGVEVTPGLVEKDDRGWYPQLRLHYFLTISREQLVDRDAKRVKASVINIVFLNYYIGYSLQVIPQMRIQEVG